MRTLLVFVGYLAITTTGQMGGPPGRLFDVAGRKLHLLCSGNGSPTVVLEAGASSFAIDWSLVQRAVARSQRVCSYDRAGMGWSEASSGFEAPGRVISDLHGLLRAANEPPPYLMVGASRGGLYVRLYQLEYPDDVAGLVLVDPATEDRLFVMYQGRIAAIASLTAEQFATTFPSSGSRPIPPRQPQKGVPFDRLPPELYDLRIKLDQQLIDSIGSTITAERAREYGEAERAMLARLLRSRESADAPMSRVPVVVLTRGLDMTDGLAENHATLARLSRNARHTVVRDSGHEVHLFAPAAVITAIADVTMAIQKQTRLPQEH